MIELIAGKMAVGIKRRAPDHPVSLAVLNHALAVLINTVSIIIFSLIGGIVTGNTREIVIIMISFAILRMVSGGLHLKTGSMCVIVTTTLFMTLSFVHVNHDVTFIFNTLSLLLALLFSPSGIENQSRIPKRFYPLLKVISALLISLNLLIGSATIAVCFLVQTLTLISRREVKN